MMKAIKRLTAMIIVAVVVSPLCAHGREPVFKLDVTSVNYSTCEIAGSKLSECPPVTPKAGVAYMHEGTGVTVLQVVGDRGVIAYSGGNIDTPIYIGTKKQYVDNSLLSRGMYVCVGRCMYESVGGTRTVWAFNEAPTDVYLRRFNDMLTKQAEEELQRQQVIERQRIEADMEKHEVARMKMQVEEKIARQREEHARNLEAARLEAEKKEQPERELYAATVLSRYKLGEWEGWYVSRRNVREVELNIDDFIWKKMVEQYRAKEWLGLLNSIYDAVRHANDFTNHYKLYPSKDEVDDLLKKAESVYYTMAIDQSISDKKETGYEIRCRQLSAKDYRLIRLVPEYAIIIECLTQLLEDNGLFEKRTFEIYQLLKRTISNRSGGHWAGLRICLGVRYHPFGKRIKFRFTHDYRDRESECMYLECSDARTVNSIGSNVIESLAVNEYLKCCEHYSDRKISKSQFIAEIERCSREILDVLKAMDMVNPSIELNDRKGKKKALSDNGASVGKGKSINDKKQKDKNKAEYEKCVICNGSGLALQEGLTCDSCKGSGEKIGNGYSGGQFVKTRKPCSKCKGRGQISKKVSCEECNGRGRVKRQ